MVAFAPCLASKRSEGVRHISHESFVVPQDDCLEMYYYLGIARDEMGQYDNQQEG